MNRFGMFAAFAAVTLSAASCRLLPAQKSEDAVADSPMADGGAPKHAPENADAQVPAPATTAPGEQSGTLSPVPTGVPTAAPTPALPFAASAAFVPMPGTLEPPSPSILTDTVLPDDTADHSTLPQPAPSAELRGLRSPKLPSNLPMSLDGKILSPSSNSH